MSKIYTKTGDEGNTSLLGGNRVPKNHPRVEAYGNIDELNSFIGLLRSNATEKHIIDSLINVQTHLYYMASLIACDSCKEQSKLTQITDADISFLEEEIDSMTKTLPELEAFIIPGGNAAISYAHITRCVCRRAERSVINLSEKTYIDNIIIIYLNRLSDYFFTLARKLTAISGIEEMKYKS
jgi:cob(I)alamin adenosyltransferase